MIIFESKTHMENRSLTTVCKEYISEMTKDHNHRFWSWDFCIDVFKYPPIKYLHSLQLASYLASWGMYRGSGGLLQKNHLIHEGVIPLLSSSPYNNLKCTEFNEIKKSDINQLLELKFHLCDYYKSIPFNHRTQPNKSISPTDTLISKIILGTLGCVPAYDQYLKDGLKHENFAYKDFSKGSLEELFSFIENNFVEIKNIQAFIKAELGMHYPVMKIVDMYFWKIGYELYLIKHTN